MLCRALTCQGVARDSYCSARTEEAFRWTRIKTKIALTKLQWACIIFYQIKCSPILQWDGKCYEFVNSERGHCLVMKPPILTFYSFQPLFSLLSLIMQLCSPVGSVDSLPMHSSPSLKSLLLKSESRKDPPVKPLLTSSLARSAAELTCDHRLYQVMWTGCPKSTWSSEHPSPILQQITNY